jgi:hypothetical protein
MAEQSEVDVTEAFRKVRQNKGEEALLISEVSPLDLNGVSVENLIRMVTFRLGWNEVWVVSCGRRSDACS